MIRHASLSLLALIAATATLAPAHADPYEEHMRHLHEACQAGNRGACVRFGIEIGRHQERDAEWRHNHPEWYWYER